jgi:hypothetical protein
MYSLVDNVVIGKSGRLHLPQIEVTVGDTGPGHALAGGISLAREDLVENHLAF